MKDEELCGKEKENEKFKAMTQEITRELVVKRDQLNRIQEYNDQLVGENERLRQAKSGVVDDGCKSSQRAGSDERYPKSLRAAIPYDMVEATS